MTITIDKNTAVENNLVWIIYSISVSSTKKKFFEKVQAVKENYLKQRKIATEEIRQIHQFFPFKNIHLNIRLSEIFFQFLSDLVLFQLHEHPSQKENQNLDDLLDIIKQEYAIYFNCRFGARNTQNIEKKLNEFLNLLQIESDEKIKLCRTFEIYLSLLSKQYLGNEYLYIFWKPEYMSDDWTYLANLFFDDPQHFSLNLEAKKNNPVEKYRYTVTSSVETIQELYTAHYSSAIKGFYKTRFQLISLGSFINNSVMANYLEIKSKNLQSTIEEDIKPWKAKQTSINQIIGQITCTIRYLNSYSKLPNTKEVLEKISLLCFKITENVPSGIAGLKFDLKVNDLKFNCFYNQSQQFNLEIKKCLDYTQIFTGTPLQDLSYLCAKIYKNTSLDKDRCSRNLTALNAKDYVPTGIPFETIEFDEEKEFKEESWMVEKASPVTHKVKKSKNINVSSKKLNTENKEGSDQKDLDSKIISSQILQTFVINHTQATAMQIFDFACQIKNPQQRVHYRQMHWHLSQLVTLEKITKEADQPIDISHMMSATVHAGWVIEQALHAQLKGKVAFEDHNLVSLAKQTSIKVSPIFRALQHSNNWERYFSNYVYFYQHSTFFYRNVSNFPKPLAFIASLANSPQRIPSSAIKNQILEIINATTEWTQIHLKEQNFTPKISNTSPEEDYIMNITVDDLDTQSIGLLKNQFNEVSSKLILTSKENHLQLRLQLSLLGDVIEKIKSSKKNNVYIFWSIRAIRLSQNLISGLLEELFFEQNAEMSKHHHHIPTLAKACNIAHQCDFSIFDGINIKSRYPLQSEINSLSCQMIDKFESYRLYPDQDKGFKPNHIKEDPWQPPLEDGIDQIHQQFKRMWDETIKAVSIILLKLASNR